MHKLSKNITLALLALVLIFSAFATGNPVLAEEAAATPKYIFLFIGDGMSYPQFQLTSDYLGSVREPNPEVLQGPEYLGFMNFTAAGTANTYDSTSFCPDSASTATSISTGNKTHSGTINMDVNKEIPFETIAEKLHKQLGYKLGIISSVNLNHATPAAFYAHQASRNSYYEIGLEMIESGFEYFAGGELKQRAGKEGSPFFMMVEGGKIDWACHANDAASVIHDTVAFSDAVDVAIAFAQDHPEETLILVTGDHETGGLTIGFAGTDYDTFLQVTDEQKIAYAKFDAEVLPGILEAQMPFEDVLKLIEENFGLKLEGD